MIGSLRSRSRCGSALDASVPNCCSTGVGVHLLFVSGTDFRGLAAICFYRARRVWRRNRSLGCSGSDWRYLRRCSALSHCCCWWIAVAGRTATRACGAVPRRHRLVYWFAEIAVFMYLFIWYRRLARYRFDQLMRIGWKVMLPMRWAC